MEVGNFVWFKPGDDWSPIQVEIIAFNPDRTSAACELPNEIIICVFSNCLFEEKPE